MDYIKTKKILISVLALITFALLITFLISFSNKPEIKEININNMTDFAFTASETSISESGNDIFSKAILKGMDFQPGNI